MANDVANICHGPAQLQLTDVEIGHTQGGIEATITPQNRPRNVDQYGVGEVAIIHTGDEVRVMVPWAELKAAVLAEVYNPGNDQSGASSGADYLGIGRSAGYIYTAQDMKIIPRLAAQAAKRIQFWKTTPIGEFSQMFDGGESDRVFEVEFAALIDPSQDDGELIGMINLTTS